MSTQRAWWWNWVLALTSPLLFLGAIEGVLRVAGSGHPAEFFLPLATDPTQLTTNPHYAERFFPKRIARTPVPIVFPRVKPPGTLRVFVLGESAAMGFPDPVWGFPRQLEAMLRAKTGKRVEVIDAAMTAIDSHIVREIAGECARYEPDWFVVYMGNNEFIGPRAWLLLTRTRLGQLLVARAQPPLKEWKGLEMFARNRIPAGDARIARVHSDFRENLSVMAEIGKAAGAKVILSTVAVNLRDLPPFAGEAASQAYAQQDYGRARDLDELRLRTSSAMNDIIREVAREQAATLVDAAATLHADGRHFYEHVHLTPEGNRALARLIAGTGEGSLTETAWDRVRMTASIAALTARPPFRRRMEPLREAIDYPAAKARYAAMVQGEPQNLVLRERYAELLREAGDTAGSAVEWRELIRRLPVIKAWHSGLADALLARGDVKEAREACERALALDPQFSAARLSLGLSYAQGGDLRSAMREFETLLGSDPESAEAHNNVGVVQNSLGRRGEAITAFEKAIAARPEFARAHDNLARTLAAAGRFAEAMEHYRTAIRHDARLPSAHYDLGVLLARSGDFAGAIGEYERTLALQPDHADAHNNWGTALARQGRMADAIVHFREALRLQPSHAEARRNLSLAQR